MKNDFLTMVFHFSPMRNDFPAVRNHFLAVINDFLAVVFHFHTHQTALLASLFSPTQVPRASK